MYYVILIYYSACSLSIKNCNEASQLHCSRFLKSVYYMLKSESTNSLLAVLFFGFLLRGSYSYFLQLDSGSITPFFIQSTLSPSAVSLP